MIERLTYEEIDTLVSLHQDGVEEATEKLLECYERYFQKFINILCYGKFLITDSTQRRFVASFISNEDIRKKIHRYRYDGYIISTMAKVANNLHCRMRYYEEEDIRQEMICIFLHLASHHNGSASFASFISYYFPLRLNTKVTKWIKEMNSKIQHEIEYNEESIEVSHYDTYNINEENDFYYIEPMHDTDFDENWVNGHTCGELFKHLTTYERRLVKWYYEGRTFDLTNLPLDIVQDRKRRLKRTEQEIAELLGCSRKTVNFKRNDIKRRIQVVAERIHLVEKGSQPSSSI